MSRRTAALITLGISLGCGSAYAQESNAPGAVEVTFMPASAGYFTAKDDQFSFGNYGFGSTATFNLNRFIDRAAPATAADLEGMGLRRLYLHVDRGIRGALAGAGRAVVLVAPRFDGIAGRVLRHAAGESPRFPSSRGDCRL